MIDCFSRPFGRIILITFRQGVLMSLLTGKKALILGIANERSIAWGITRKLKEQGATIGLTYLNDQLKKWVAPLSEQIGADFLVPMDVTNDQHYLDLKQSVAKNWGKFDILVHSLAFADREDLKRRFSDTSREGFKMACDISAFSLIGLCHYLRDLMNPGGSVISLTYHGSQLVYTGYNVMGVAKAALEASSRYLADDLGSLNIRVNTISSGPIRTLAASAVGVKELTKVIEERSPLKRNVSTEDVGGAAVFLASDLSQAVTGQVLFVDSGFSIMGI